MPQRQWTEKEERQYRHIRDQAEDRGVGHDRAEEIAARTVNKERARKGKTKTASRTSTQDKSSSERGGQRSHSGPKGRTKEQLYQEARRKNVKGRSKMNKAELQRAVDRRS
ncbi:plasmid stabilization protein [Glycomyces sp. YM15]|uniref:plasmid stabilization protein n=1 Tax=Glycomyces sp. YM15 TaxID=2800446 RepID=UPI001964ED92|nr:plasmid stabilization protein [Glycomyces sp. YM15]